MAAMEVIPKLEFLTTLLQNKGSSNHHQIFQRNASSGTGTMSFNSSEFMSLKLSSPHIKQCKAMTSSDHELDPFRPQEQDEEEEDPIGDKNTKDELQNFVAREASLSEEYKGAAWLRAEVHFEDQPNLRHLNTFKVQFAEQEYTAIKRRSKLQFGHKYMCIVMVATVLPQVRNEEKNGKQTLREGLVGTVDVYIGQFLHGETFPPESIETHIFQFVQKPDSISYSYVANLCVAKSARRQGVASTMLRFAIEHSKASGKNMYKL